MGNKVVKGFGGNAGSQEVPRHMAIAKQIGHPVSEYTGPVSADVRFHRMELAYHGEDEGPVAHRPYLEFEGKIRSISAVEDAELPGNCRTVLFEEVNAPVIRGRWELSNAEIAELAEKGVFGGNSQVMPSGLRPVATDPDNPFVEEKAVRSQLQVPSIFTEVQFDGVPVECSIQAMNVNVHGRDIPVVVANPVGRTAGSDGIILTSASTGYGDIAQYFGSIELYEHGDPSQRKDYVSMAEDQWIRDQEEKAIVDAMAKKMAESKDSIKGPKILTLPEQAEQRELAGLRHEIDDRVEQAETQRMVDEAVAWEGSAGELAEEHQQAAQAAQEGQEAAFDGQGGSQYLQADEGLDGVDTDRLDAEDAGAYEEHEAKSEEEEAENDKRMDAAKQAAELTAEEEIEAARKQASQISGSGPDAQRDMGDE